MVNVKTKLLTTGMMVPSGTDNSYHIVSYKTHMSKCEKTKGLVYAKTTSEKQLKTRTEL